MMFRYKLKVANVSNGLLTVHLGIYLSQQARPLLGCELDFFLER